jgi:hypothetical protein
LSRAAKYDPLQRNEKHPFHAVSPASRHPVILDPIDDAMKRSRCFEISIGKASCVSAVAILQPDQFRAVAGNIRDQTLAPDHDRYGFAFSGHDLSLSFRRTMANQLGRASNARVLCCHPQTIVRRRSMPRGVSTGTTLMQPG